MLSNQDHWRSKTSEIVRLRLQRKRNMVPKLVPGSGHRILSLSRISGPQLTSTDASQHQRHAVRCAVSEQD